MCPAPPTGCYSLRRTAPLPHQPSQCHGQKREHSLKSKPGSPWFHLFDRKPGLRPPDLPG